MGKSDRQVVAGQRLATLRQRISFDGLSGVTTATLENAAEAAEEIKRPHEAPYAFTGRYATPKRRGGTFVRDQMNNCTGSSPNNSHTTAPSEDKWWTTSLGIVVEETSGGGSGVGRHEPPEDVYGTSGDEREALGPA